MDRSGITALDRPRLSASSAGSLGPSGAATRPGTRPAAMALKALARSDLHERFQVWKGWSGKRYMFSVFDAAEPNMAQFDNAVVIAASRSPDGTRSLLHLGQTGRIPELHFASVDFAQALADGATELHVHLLASSRSARDDVVSDLRPK